MTLPPFDIRRSKRAKRIRIAVKGERVELVLPLHVPERLGLAFLEEKKDWILKSIAAVKKRDQLLRKQGVENGDLIQWEGRWLPIFRTTAPMNSPPMLRYIDERFQLSAPLNINEESLRTCIASWLGNQTLERVKSLVAKYVDRGAPKPRSIRLGRNKRAWGSCGSTGVLRIHWRLIQAPVSVFDYVVIHEICHLKHPHHQDSFWREVASWMPDYSLQHRALKTWEKGPRTIS